MASGDNTLRHKLDRFWAALFLTPEGKPKSATLLYSFCLSILYLAIYGISYFFLIDVLERLLSAQSVTVRNIFESVVPGLAGTVVCCSLWFVIRNRRIVPGAYVWLALYAVASLVAMVLMSSGEDFRIFLYFYLMLVPAGLVSGAAFTLLMFLKTLRTEAGAK
ncbi:MAG TPA: hypothetical protein VN540_08270 [Clostridia bacterium]|nr:hypothetical protein [Clostridia bacterium]